MALRKKRKELKDKAARGGSGSRSASRWKAVLLLAAVSVLAYIQTLSFAFVYDDHMQVLRNPWIKDASHIREILSSSLWSFYGHTSNTYRPVLHLAFMAEYRLFGYGAWGYHLVNTLLHAINTILVFALSVLLFSQKTKEPAEAQGKARILKFREAPARAGLMGPLFAGLIFALHPVNSEAVAWVSAITELTYTMFVLASLSLYALARDEEENPYFYYVVSVISFAIALLSKETAMVLPLLVVFLDLSSKGVKETAGRWKAYIVYFAALALYLALRTYAVGGVVHHKQAPVEGAGLVMTAFELIYRYILKIIYPSDLSALYGFKYLSSFSEPAVIAGFSATVLFMAALAASRKNPLVFTGLLILALPVLPVLYIPALSNSAMADRYLYLPTAGLGLIASYMIEKARSTARCTGLFSGRPRVVCAAALILPLLVSVLYGAGTLLRTPVWKDDFTLWTDTVEKSPESKYAHYNLALAYKDLSDMDGAIAHLKEAVRIDPGYENAQYNLAWSYQSKGDNINAVAHYKEALRINPDSADIHYNLGIIYKGQFLLEEAQAEFREALRLKPDYAEARSMLEELKMLRGY